MRCHYLSDLHLETQDFHWPLPKGEVLIVAGDLCHARCLAPATQDKYGIAQRERVLRFIDAALTNFAHVLLVAGNHEHYDGFFDDTASLMRQHLSGVHVLDNGGIVIDGVHFFGTTLWSDFDGRSQACMDGVRRRCGEYFFVKKGCSASAGRPAKFQPEDALGAFDTAWRALRTYLDAGTAPAVVITHHAPSLMGLNTAHSGNGLDGAFASDLDADIAGWPRIAAWVHGHTHVRRTYTIGSVVVRVNCRGFDGRDSSARSFTPNVHFDV